MVMPFSLRIALQHVGRLVHLGMIEAVEALVRQQQLGLGGERARQLELLQRGGAEPVDGGVRIARQVDQAQRLLRLAPARRRGRSCRAARTRPTGPRSRAASGCGTDAGSDRCGRCPCGRRCRPAGRAISSPAKRIEPAVGASMPAMQLKVVLLPEPLGPIRPRISPSLTSNETLETAVKPSNFLVRPETERMTTEIGALHELRWKGARAGPRWRADQRERARAGGGSSAALRSPANKPADMARCIPILPGCSCLRRPCASVGTGRGSCQPRPRVILRNAPPPRRGSPSRTRGPARVAGRSAR